MESMSLLASIIIPVYNEEDSVFALYGEIRKAIDPINKPYEIIFIDDGSTDKTFDYLKAIKKMEGTERNRLVRTIIIKFTHNFGQTAAMQAGIDQARAGIIFSLDGDLQNDPRDIPKLLKKLEEGYDIVCGWRKCRKDKKLSRIFPSVVANWLIHKITGIPVHDNGCSLKGYRSSVIKSVRLYSDMHRFIPAMASTVGAKITEIEVNHRPRKFGETKYGLSRIWKVFFDLITIKLLIHFYSRPILWFASFGIIFLLLGIVLGIASIYSYFNGDWSVVYFTSTFLYFYLFASLFTWGLLSEFFVKIEKKGNISILSL